MKVKTMLGVLVLALMLPLTASATPYFGTLSDGQIFDMWTFTVGAGGSGFSADTLSSPNNAAGTRLDTQLWIFDSNWLGVVANDDSSAGNSLSKVSTPLGPGTYYLAISMWNDDPVNSAGGRMFPDVVGQVGPNLPRLALAGWAPGVGQGYPYNGDYVLNLVGVESAAPVPEPASMTLFGTGLAVLYRTYRKRQKA
jgi:hypothetical protein